MKRSEGKRHYRTGCIYAGMAEIFGRNAAGLMTGFWMHILRIMQGMSCLCLFTFSIYLSNAFFLPFKFFIASTNQGFALIPEEKFILTIGCG